MPKIERVLCEDWGFVAVVGVVNGEHVVGLWWKGDPWKEGKDCDGRQLGFPNSFGRPTYFHLPEALAEMCLRFDWLLRRVIGPPWEED